MTVIPIRLAILQALTAHLERITPGAGYQHDLSGKVFRGMNLIGADRRDLPALSILEAPRPDIAIFAGDWSEMRYDQWTLLIQGMAQDDKRNPSDPAYYLCADVEQQLSRITATRPATGNPAYPQEHLLGGLITGLELAPPVVRPPEDKVSTTAFFFLPVRVGVAVDTGRPYTSR